MWSWAVLTGAKGMVALWAEQMCVHVCQAPLPAHWDTTGCWLSPWLLCVLLQVGPLHSSQSNGMGQEEWIRVHRQEWGKTSHLFKAQLKCHLLHETFPNSSPSCTPYTFSRSKRITLSSLSSWHVTPSFSLVFILKFSTIPTALKLEGALTRGCWIPEVQGLLAVGQALLC